MKVLFHGAGALGGYFGGRMLEAGYNVSYLVRERRAEQLRKEGLKIHSPAGDYENKEVKLYTSTEEIEEMDLIILAVKGYHLQQAIPQIKVIAQRTGAFVLPLLNGMEHIQQLREAVGIEKVLGGFASIIATLNDKGHVIHSNKGSAIKFGALHEAQVGICEKLEEINHDIQAAILREDDILKHMWKKYIFITAFSGVTSATKLPAGFIANIEATYRVARNVVLEMSQLAGKEGISFSEEEVDKIVSSMRGLAKEATSSMHQDLRKGLPIEVEHLHGGALRMAAKHDLQLPVIETLYGLLKPYENGEPNNRQ
ncbi:2-dehydropantoate 2-reductase [Oceanobacillus piezotolerans]|uniref:2-dehydropantoate 2-reductase n=1 Tax=Oceanobacillus piezotolerans TaxID=2448030 RepID=A0A498DIW0_9BACI|nr:2-dehydropantoate 2-reductase [Oceanobacillus piezotolerans]RLL45445.1 2-dehydropantoate 2-reductase [Oceanobacillus piezotolerans]